MPNVMLMKGTSAVHVELTGVMPNRAGDGGGVVVVVVEVVDGGVVVEVVDC